MVMIDYVISLTIVGFLLRIERLLTGITTRMSLCKRCPITKIETGD